MRAVARCLAYNSRNNSRYIENLLLLTVLMITATLRIQIGDFGLATMKHTHSSAAAAAARVHSSARTVSGSLPDHEPLSLSPTVPLDRAVTVASTSLPSSDRLLSNYAALQQHSSNNNNNNNGGHHSSHNHWSDAEGPGSSMSAGTTYYTTTVQFVISVYRRLSNVITDSMQISNTAVRIQCTQAHKHSM
jgi:hypothetical protein